MMKCHDCFGGEELWGNPFVYTPEGEWLVFIQTRRKTPGLSHGDIRRGP